MREVPLYGEKWTTHVEDSHMSSAVVTVQGYLAHKKRQSHLTCSRAHMHSCTCGHLKSYSRTVPRVLKGS